MGGRVKIGGVGIGVLKWVALKMVVAWPDDLATSVVQIQRYLLRRSLSISAVPRPVARNPWRGWFQY